MNKDELQLLDIEALLESSDCIAEQLRLSGLVVMGNTVDELCRRLKVAKDAFIHCHESDTSIEATTHYYKTVHEDFGVELKY